MFWRYVIAWLPMVGLAIFNGTLREFALRKVMTGPRAHQVSTVTLILLFSIYVWLVDRRWPLESIRMAAAVGAVWLLLTVSFEFWMGRVISHQSWSELLRAYNILDGQLWVLVPLSVGLLPSLVFWTRATR